MPELGLYYPYFHVRDDTWLKAAALYWPKLGRTVPNGYPLHESLTAHYLRNELGFFVDIDPTPYVMRIAPEFVDLIAEHQDDFSTLYAMSSDIRQAVTVRHWEGRQLTGGELNSGLVWIDAHTKTTAALRTALVDTGIGVVRGPWNGRVQVGMHPRVGYVYLASLAYCMAELNDMSLVTDQDDVSGTPSGWTMASLAEALLDVSWTMDSADRDGEDVAWMYAVAAIQTVVPKGLKDVPVERIVRARHVLADEFDSFRDHLDSMSAQFQKLAKITSSEVLTARLELLVERDLRRSTEDLERGLRSLGFEPARAVLSMKPQDLLATSAVAAIGVPAVVSRAGLAAAQLFTSSTEARRRAVGQRRGPAGYLLGLREELDPRGVVDRARRTLRSMTGPARRGRRWRRAWRSD